MEIFIEIENKTTKTKTVVLANCDIKEALNEIKKFNRSPSGTAKYKVSIKVRNHNITSVYQHRYFDVLPLNYSTLNL